MYILGIHVDNLSKSAVLVKIQQLLLSNETGLPANSAGKQIVTTNPEFILTAQKDEQFKNIINNSWLSVPDGYGLRLAAKYIQLTTNNQHLTKNKNFFRPFFLFFFFLFLGLKIAVWGFLKRDEKLDIIKETITGTDLMGEICKLTANSQQSTIKIFLLGGYGDTPRLTMEKLQTMAETRHQNLSSGQMRASLQIAHSTFEENNIIEKINSFQPAILFVALNHPKAQKWIAENLPQMPSVKLAMGVGGAFDYLSGKIKRAPAKWQGSFEWMYRLWHQPRRLRRIWRASIAFPWKVLKSVIR